MIRLKSALALLVLLTLASVALPATATATPGLFTTYYKYVTATGNFAGGVAVCDAGDVATGGGGTHIRGTRPSAIAASRPDGSAGWHTRYVGGDTSTEIAVFVVCANLTP
jgi:hypothetical protein